MNSILFSILAIISISVVILSDIFKMIKSNKHNQIKYLIQETLISIATITIIMLINI